MASQQALHFLLVPAVAWGHTRPICHLGLRLLSSNVKIVVTILTSNHLFERTRAEVRAHLRHDDYSRIRVLCSSVYTGTDPFEFFESHNRSYTATYETLHNQKPITCLATGIVHKPFPSPVVVLMDCLTGPQVLWDTKALTGNSVPVFAWATGFVPTIVHIWGPEYLGGMGNVAVRAAEEADRTGEAADNIGNRLMSQTSGRIIELPGLPPFYDYELFPQEAIGIPIFRLIKGCYEIFENCDGVLASASHVIEGDCIKGAKKWFNGIGKEIFCVGPLLPLTYWSESQPDHGAADVPAFLNKMNEKYGDKSVTVVTFGTHFWPPVPEYIEEVILSLIEKEVPFVLTVASPQANIAPDLRDKINSYELGIFSYWIPQQQVLTHPATGWLLTHSGQGGVTEALSAGIPLICWPISGDQPMMALHATHTLGVAFELIEVRSGTHGLKPIYSLGGRKPKGTRDAVRREIRRIIDDTRGEVGHQLHKNAQALKTELRKSWEKDGIATKELQAFVGRITQRIDKA